MDASDIFSKLKAYCAENRKFAHLVASGSLTCSSDADNGHEAALLFSALVVVGNRDGLRNREIDAALHFLAEEGVATVTTQTWFDAIARLQQHFRQGAEGGPWSAPQVHMRRVLQSTSIAMQLTPELVAAARRLHADEVSERCAS